MKLKLQTAEPTVSRLETVSLKAEHVLISTGIIKWMTYPFMANTIHFRTASLFCFLGDSIIAITLLSPYAVTALSTYNLQVRL